MSFPTAKLSCLSFPIRFSAHDDVSFVCDEPLQATGTFIIPAKSNDVERQIACSLHFGRQHLTVEGRQYATWRYVLDYIFQDFSDPLLPSAPALALTVGSSMCITETQFQYTTAAFVTEMSKNANARRIMRAEHPVRLLRYLQISN